MSLDGKAALVTGGGSGIGLASARALAELGVRVFLVGRNEKKLANAASTLGSGTSWAAADLADPVQAQRAADLAAGANGRIDILLNSAGVYGLGSILETGEKDWDYIFDNNLKQVYLVSRSVIPYMEKEGGGGAVINLASTLGLKSVPGCAAYCAAKAGLISLTRSMALDHAAAGIRVNCIAPGVVETPIHAETIETMGLEFWRSKFGPIHPLGRVGTAGDVARLVVYLADEESSSWITGAVIPVDGGLSAG
ncbi:MAG: SDR family oxidoreductase [Candidatus Glassbacteria bacterium]|nr:SDR family oxidoreductase [Candidatus Glassbacteria bacterium]